MRKIILLLLLSVFILSQTSAYTTYNGIQHGDVVNMRYVLTVDGKIKDQSSSFETAVTDTDLIVGFYEEILGMKVGQQKEFEVPPEKGYSSGELAGKTLYFDVYINKIVEDINGGGEITEIASELQSTENTETVSSNPGTTVIEDIFANPIFQLVSAFVVIFYLYIKMTAGKAVAK